jgi:hypothetical protein
LMYIAHERCDVQFAAKEIARGAAKLSTGDIVRIKRVGRYMAGTRQMENILAPDAKTIFDLVVCVDSNWATDKVDRRSTSCGHIFVNGALVTSYSRTQPVPALSSGEAELYALGTGTCEGLLIQSLIRELPIDMEVEMTVESDSSAAISSQLRGGLGRMKHVELRHMFMQQLVKEKRMKLRKIPGEDNSSDLGTKYLERVTFEKHRHAAGLRSRGGDAERGQVNAIVQNSPQNGVEMTLMGMAKCFAGIQAMMQVKGVGAVRCEDKNENEILLGLYVTTVPVILLALVLALAFVGGFWFGRAQAETRAPEPAARGVHVSTNTYENDIVLGLADLTVEVLRRNLRSLHCSPSGTKAELIVKLQYAMQAQRLRVSVQDDEPVRASS